jgi:cytochrome c
MFRVFDHFFFQKKRQVKKTFSLADNFLLFAKISGAGIFLIMILWSSCADFPGRERRLLVFYSDDPIHRAVSEAGLQAFEHLADQHGFRLVATSDSGQIDEAVLQTFSAVVFLNSTGDNLNAFQRADLQRFIEAGGGFIGMHDLPEKDYEWQWYGRLVGAHSEGRPSAGRLNLHTTDSPHPAVRRLPQAWEHADEWRSCRFAGNQPDVLLSVKTGTAQLIPVSWSREFEGGRVFFTTLGRVPESYQNGRFLDHLWGAIEYATDGEKLDYSRCRSHRVPEENRFVRTVLTQYLDEPMELDILPDGRVLFVERKGRLRMYIPSQERLVTITKIPVYSGHEDGLLGLAIDPRYEENHWIYLCYSPPGSNPVQYVSRFVFWDDSLHYSSEKVVLEIPVQRDECCHSGGSLEFDPDGNLFISVGDNTNPFASDGYAPIDERPGRQPWDAQRSSANADDLRGKILRIHPEPDGSYTIPEGNLFPPGTPGTRPEIFVMGCRNPFRISIDARTGYLYWGDVGPDAGEPGELRGPKGLDGINQAKAAGFWGWPYSRGNNQPYYDYDFVAGRSGELFDPARPFNDSPNNTGIKKLPPAQSSLIWYSYDHSEEFPWTGTGGKNPMAGPVYYSHEYNGRSKFPPYFDGKLVIYEWMRHWIYVIDLDSAGQFLRADPFMPGTKFSRPMDMAFGRDGSLYLLEYGEEWFKQNPDARLSRISYIEGNRPPIARIEADRTAGGVPFKVRFSAKTSEDFDGDPLSFEWRIDGQLLEQKTANLDYTFNRAGAFEVELRVKDPAGAQSAERLQVKAGNEPPSVAIELEDNRTFYWDGRPLQYRVVVEDREEGRPGDPGFDPERVFISFDYLPEAYDLTEVARGHKAGLEAKSLSPGAILIEGSDCRNCHAIDKQVNGPSYLEIARRYQGRKDITQTLAEKIIKGGAGNWGQTVMSAHPTLNFTQATQMVEYILSLAEPKAAGPAYPLQGVLTATVPKGKIPGGTFLISAAFTDRGQGPIEPMTGRDLLILRPLKIQAERSEILGKGLGAATVQGFTTLSGMRHGDSFGFKNIDLNGIASVSVSLIVEEVEGGLIEIRIGNPTGKKIGEAILENLPKGPAEIQIPLQQETSMSDFYLIFKNPENSARIMGYPDWIIFEHEKAAGVN